MGILITLIILLFLVQLGRSCYQEATIRLIGSEQIITSASIKSNGPIYLFLWAVKLEERALYLLNTVAASNALQGNQISLIYNEFHTIRG
ncbi:hypothetical protein [Falsiporphyromonas endometrii]|uniref:Uncharacterized protein n=1 Tax=Falsiporphyromonas endometrii TaxID=1387297 RepID=A0ABV9K7U9_9PORP